MPEAKVTDRSALHSVCFEGRILFSVLASSIAGRIVSFEQLRALSADAVQLTRESA